MTRGKIHCLIVVHVSSKLECPRETPHMIINCLLLFFSTLTYLIKWIHVCRSFTVLILKFTLGFNTQSFVRGHDTGLYEGTLCEVETRPSILATLFFTSLTLLLCF